jgi:hypothetical protein
MFLKVFTYDLQKKRKEEINKKKVKYESESMNKIFFLLALYFFHSFVLFLLAFSL